MQGLLKSSLFWFYVEHVRGVVTILLLSSIGHWGWSVTFAFAEDSPLEQPLKIVTDPLAWVKLPLTCEGFIDQLRARYEPLGTFRDLPEVKKNEVRQILEMACSERFRHCKFESCRRRPPSSTPPSPVTPTNPITDDNQMDPRKVAEKLLKELYDAKVGRDQEVIAKKIAEEQKGKFYWQRFSMPGELINPERENSHPKSEETQRSGRQEQSEQLPKPRIRQRRPPLAQ